jgi:hypothetical protein
MKGSAEESRGGRRKEEGVGRREERVGGRRERTDGRRGGEGGRAARQRREQGGAQHQLEIILPTHSFNQLSSYRAFQKPFEISFTTPG